MLYSFDNNTHWTESLICVSEFQSSVMMIRLYVTESDTCITESSAYASFMFLRLFFLYKLLYNEIKFALIFW